MRRWLPAVATTTFIAAHGIILYSATSHMALSAAAMTAVVTLVVLKHLGLFGPLYALLRRRWHTTSRS